MKRMKTLPSVCQTDPLMHRLMTDHGFIARSEQGKTKYQAKFQDVSCKKEYIVSVPVQPAGNGMSRLMMNEAVFEGGSRVPHAVTEAAISKLQEVADYLRAPG